MNGSPGEHTLALGYLSVDSLLGRTQTAGPGRRRQGTLADGLLPAWPASPLSLPSGSLLPGPNGGGDSRLAAPAPAGPPSHSLGHAFCSVVGAPGPSPEGLPPLSSGPSRAAIVASLPGP